MVNFQRLHFHHSSALPADVSAGLEWIAALGGLELSPLHDTNYALAVNPPAWLPQHLINQRQAIETGLPLNTALYFCGETSFPAARILGASCQPPEGIRHIQLRQIRKNQISLKILLS